MNDKSLQPVDPIAALEALARLLTIAQRDTGQSSRVASFVLAWHNTGENGGGNPVDLWQLDDAICVDVLLVFRLIAQKHRYPDDLGFGPEIAKVWERWIQTFTGAGPLYSRLEGSGVLWRWKFTAS